MKNSNESKPGQNGTEAHGLFRRVLQLWEKGPGQGRDLNCACSLFFNSVTIGLTPTWQLHQYVILAESFKDRNNYILRLLEEISFIFICLFYLVSIYMFPCMSQAANIWGFYILKYLLLDRLCLLNTSWAYALTVSPKVASG